MQGDTLLPAGGQTSPERMLSETSTKPVGIPSPKAQSWGVVISIVVIVLMIVIGAFYAWGERISQNNSYPSDTASE